MISYYNVVPSVEQLYYFVHYLVIPKFNFFYQDSNMQASRAEYSSCRILIKHIRNFQI